MRSFYSALVLWLACLPVQAAPTTQAAWLEANAAQFVVAPDSTPQPVPRPLRDARVILLGEIHGLAHGQQADFAMLRALHRQADVRHYLGEFDAAQADAFNRMLDSGDVTSLDSVFDAWRARGLQWANADFRAKLLAIAAWNRTLPARGRVRFIGVDEIQDRPAFCRWLHQRLEPPTRAPALIALRTALADPTRCDGAGALAEAALASAGPLDSVTRDAIAALAVDASVADREARIAANITRHLRARRGRFYGLWGLYHVVQAEVNGTAPMALQLVRSGVPVRSIALLNLDGEMMIPAPSADGGISFGTMPYTVDRQDVALVNGIEPFAAMARAPLTLFVLTGRKSPFRNSDALTRVGGRLSQMQPFVIDPTSAPSGLWTDAVIVSRGSRATRPLE